MHVTVTQAERRGLERVAAESGETLSTTARAILLSALPDEGGRRLSPELRAMLVRELVMLDAELAEAERRGLLPVVPS